MAPPIVSEVLALPGDRLDAGVGEMMSKRIGHDFSEVRVHADSRAGESARAVGASAYTVGKDVVFGSGKYDPGSSAGRRLIAHELVHVLQQSSAGSIADDSLEVAEADGQAERDADTAAAIVATGGRRPVHASSERRRLRRQLETHAGLFERARHVAIGGPTFSPVAKYDVRLEFTPYEVDDCDQIAMTQTVVDRKAGSVVYASAEKRARALTAAEGAEGVTIDRLAGRKSPLYGVSDVGAATPTTHFGNKHPKGAAEKAWIEDKPGNRARPAGETYSADFETCAICNAGTDNGAYYGCVAWGFDVDAADAFHEHAFTAVSRGTPSATFIAAAKKWNAQTVPVATTDLPLPTHVTRGTNLTWAQLEAEIKSLDTALKAMAAGHADRPQVTFELHVYRDIRQAILYNQGQGYTEAEVKAIQAAVKATPDGTFGFQTVIKVKQWQARNGLTTDGRVGPTTAKKMGIRP